MTARLLPLLAVLLLPFPTLGVPDEPEGPPPADEPLPAEAVVRFGVAHPILRYNPAVGLVPPKFKNFLAPTTTGRARRYDLETGRPLEKGFVGPGRVVVSADGKRAAVARPGALNVVEVSTGKLLLAVRPPEGVVVAGTPLASLSSDGERLAYGGRGQEGKGEAVVWDVDRNKLVSRVATAHLHPVAANLSADGKTLVTHGPPLPAPVLSTNPAAKAAPKAEADPGPERTAQVWDADAGEEHFRARVTGQGGMVVTSAFSPDSELLALSAGDGPVELWDVKKGKRRQTLLGRVGQGVKVAISPDGKTIASVGPDYRIQRWDADGKPLGVTDPPPGGGLVAQISGLTFADNERIIAWLTVAQFVIAWEAPSGKLLSPEMDHAAEVISLAFP
jgi:WD40 repeat protein